MIILVLQACMPADTYSPFGNWYYVDRQPTGLGTKTVSFGVYQSFLQAVPFNGPGAVLSSQAISPAAAYDREGLLWARMTFGLFEADFFGPAGLAEMWLLTRCRIHVFAALGDFPVRRA